MVHRVDASNMAVELLSSFWLEWPCPTKRIFSKAGFILVISGSLTWLEVTRGLLPGSSNPLEVHCTHSHRQAHSCTSTHTQLIKCSSCAAAGSGSCHRIFYLRWKCSSWLMQAQRNPRGGYPSCFVTEHHPRGTKVTMNPPARCATWQLDLLMQSNAPHNAWQCIVNFFSNSINVRPPQAHYHLVDITDSHHN